MRNKGGLQVCCESVHSRTYLQNVCWVITAESTVGFYFPLQGKAQQNQSEARDRWAPLFDCFEVSLKRLFEM